jgi:hypothetical protein
VHVATSVKIKLIILEANKNIIFVEIELQSMNVHMVAMEI